MIVLEDTRNKPDKNRHIREQIESIGHKVERSKIYCGDYTWATNQSVCVDTKQGMGEIESNLIHDHERFRAECIRAKEAGIKLIVLIQDKRIKQLSDVFAWYNPRLRFSKKAVTGVQLGKIMCAMRDRYGVEWEFTTKENCGKRVVELLGGDSNAV